MFAFWFASDMSRTQYLVLSTQYAPDSIVALLACDLGFQTSEP
jgi:hypothetical protein